MIVNADVLKTRKDAVMRFVQGLSRGGRLDVFGSRRDHALCREGDEPEEFVRRSIQKIYPKAALQTDEMKDMDGIQRDAVKLKFLDQPLSKEQLAELLQIPPR